MAAAAPALAFAIVDLFRDFYTEIIRQKDRVARLRGNYSPLDTQDAATTAQDAGMALEVRTALLTVLQSQGAATTRTSGSFGRDRYREAQYVMAAVADEVFLNLDWPGRTHWSLLESTLFQTHAAGDLFFQRADELLRQGDVSRTDMAMVYFTALALGYKGRYRGAADQSPLDDYRNRLYAMIYRRSPDLIRRDDILLPENYVVSSEATMRRLLPDPRRWFVLVAAILVLWLAGSHFLWSSLTDRVSHLATCIEDPSQNCSASDQEAGR
jgi:type VI secretion system protein ImpK